MEDAKILIIDDEEEFLYALRDTLQHHGYDVITATDGDEGITKAKKVLPALVICDIKMPKKNGYEVLKELRQNHEKWIPFVMLTAVGEFDKIKEAYEGECDFYVTKPVEMPILLKNVRTLINLGKNLSTRKST